MCSVSMMHNIYFVEIRIGKVIISINFLKIICTSTGQSQLNSQCSNYVLETDIVKLGT